jgi:shikimate 5-dehydrogenase
MNKADTGDGGGECDSQSADTHILQEAGRRGCITLDGLGMLLNQEGIAIKYWTGVDADPQIMREEQTRVMTG